MSQLQKADPNKQQWEESEFPIVCETCLGDNPYVRMTKQSFGKECKICSRPFTVFRWLPGTNMRYKKTEICQICAKLKNVCQTCVLDLQYGLPVQVRDEALNIHSEAPNSDVNRQYYAQNIAGKGEDEKNMYDPNKLTASSREVLQRLARSEPYYKRNRPHICSFFVKGECTRGSNCPYRHELPGDPELAQQNIKDRYYGSNDPVAAKIMSRVRSATSSLNPPEDKTVTSLFVTGVEQTITEADLREHFSTYGQLKSVVVVHKSKCAFVNFATRTAAELAADRIADAGLTLQGHPLRVTWGKARPQGPKSDKKKSAASSISLGAMQPPAPPSISGSTAKYPSQDPTAKGSNV
ncbi:hypothetical protein O0I10_012686 [Lichtheimia ornata]|uniref:Pre-mRNA-splicing factor SLT11 n=1 Tax=Lichtheimia ornata TaxID=688661 RepID=A0AAD7XPD6_9FUNG|nr:uncharacterized protein O0I10_012686 [Lichtheimia ornata]KAJ8651739.1 hypothetical protein O0I10_012686 [Lichtheimia ornata]